MNLERIVMPVAFALYEAATEAARGWAFDGGSSTGKAHLHLQPERETSADPVAVPEGAERNRKLKESING